MVCLHVYFYFSDILQSQVGCFKHFCYPEEENMTNDVNTSLMYSTICGVFVLGFARQCSKNAYC